MSEDLSSYLHNADELFLCFKVVYRDPHTGFHPQTLVIPNFAAGWESMDLTLGRDFSADMGMY